MTRTVFLPSPNRRVTLGQYVAALRRAKAEPAREFRQTLETWWPGTGQEVVDQFRRAMHRRISDGIPYSQRGAL